MNVNAGSTRSRRLASVLGSIEKSDPHGPRFALRLRWQDFKSSVIFLCPAFTGLEIDGA